MRDEVQQTFNCSKRRQPNAEKQGSPPIRIAACMSETAECNASVLPAQSAMGLKLTVPWTQSDCQQTLADLASALSDL